MTGPISRSALRVAGLCLAGALLVGPASASVTGVCPDGSMFIVQQEADIPCPESRRVEPSQLPPIRPQYLPRPYAWEVHQTRQDPNNPYNLVERAETIREFQEQGGDEPPLEAAEPAGELASASAPRPAPVPSQAAAAPAPPRLALAPEETRDLSLIVELTQDRVPARFAPGEPPALRVDLAHSAAFEARLHGAFPGAPLGPVVLFAAQAVAPAAFQPNFTFVQGHGATSPDRQDPRSFGFLDGGAGALDAGQRVLGYTVLPGDVDLSQPLDVYWDDHRISVVLRPQ